MQSFRRALKCSSLNLSKQELNSLEKEKKGDPPLSFTATLTLTLVTLPVIGLTQNPSEPRSPTELDAVYVTAQKREQVLKDVPIAIAAVDGDAIERQGFTDFERLSTRIPGFFVQQQTDSSASFVMRGIEAGNADAASEPSISFFLNEVDTSRSRGLLKELFDIERVEVAKGPQGTLYGRGSQIGAVAVHTRKADPNEFSSILEGQIGNYNLYSLGGVLNMPLVQEQLGLRVAMRQRKRDGYATNITNGRKINDDDLLAARVSLRWLPGDTTSLDLIIDHQADDDAAVMTKAINIASPGGDTSPYSHAAQNLYDPPQRRRQTGITLLADWQPNAVWSARAISAWREVEFSEAWDIDGTSYHFLIGRNLVDDQRILSQEFRLAYDAGERFRSIFGISYYNDKTWNLAEITINEQLMLAGFPNSTIAVTHTLVNGVMTPVSEGVSTLISTRSDRDSWSAYVNFGYDLSPRWVVDAGVRYTWDEATLLNFRSVSSVDGIAPIVLPNGLGNSLGQEFSNRRRYSLMQPRLALTWHVSDEINLYTGVSRGLRSGYPRTNFGAPQNGLPQPVFEELKTEEVLNYEIGAKGTIGPGFYFEVIGFTYDYKDFQTRSEDITVGVINAGRASARGLETMATWQATRDLTLTAAYAWLKTEYDEFSEVVGGALVDRSGNVFRMAPRHTVSIGADWRHALVGNWETFANGHYAWRSDFYLNNDNLKTEMQKAFGLFDLRLGIERHDGLRLEVYAENLLDQKWVRDIGNGGKQFGVPTSIRANPRMYGLRLRMQW